MLKFFSSDLYDEPYFTVYSAAGRHLQDGTDCNGIVWLVFTQKENVPQQNKGNFYTAHQ